MKIKIKKKFFKFCNVVRHFCEFCNENSLQISNVISSVERH